MLTIAPGHLLRSIFSTLILSACKPLLKLFTARLDMDGTSKEPRSTTSTREAELNPELILKNLFFTIRASPKSNEKIEKRTRLSDVHRHPPYQHARRQEPAGSRSSRIKQLSIQQRATRLSAAILADRARGPGIFTLGC